MSTQSQKQDYFSGRCLTSISTASFDIPSQYPRHSEFVLETLDSASSLSSAHYNGSGRSFPSRHSIALYPSASTSTDFKHLATPVSTRRFSEIHGGALHYPSMGELHLSGMSSEALPQSKQSFTNSRSSQRYSTHFETSNKELAIQDIVSTTTFSESDSEPDPSLYDISAADFPEPPPIGSPVIRRMRSSPWFLSERGSDKEFADVHHWRSRVPVDLLSHSRRYESRLRPPSTVMKKKMRIEPFCSTGQDSENTFYGRQMASSSHDNIAKSEFEHWERLRPFDLDGLSSSDLHLGLSMGNTSSESKISADRLTSRPIRFSKDLPSKVGLTNNSERSDCGHYTVSSKQETRPLTLASLPRIIRKVASMRSDGQKGDICGGDRFHTSNRNGQKKLPKARSFRSMLQTSEGGHAFKHNNQNLGARDVRPSGSLPRDIKLGPKQASNNQISNGEQYEDSNRQRIWCHHLSSPVTGAGVSGSSDHQWHSTFAYDGNVPRRLGEPFSHRSEQRNVSQKTLFGQEQPNATKSFIDFTPEQGTKPKPGDKRERVKNIVARASNSILGWGKWRTKILLGRRS